MPTNANHRLFRKRGGSLGKNEYRLTRDPEMRQKDDGSTWVYLYAGSDRFYIEGKGGNDLAGRMATYASKGDTLRIESVPSDVKEWGSSGWRRVTNAEILTGKDAGK